MLISDPRPSRESGMSIIKLFLAGNISGISGFLEYFTFDPGKRQKNSRLGRLIFPKAEVFPARKSLISDIPGFPAKGQVSLVNIFNSVEWVPNVITDIIGYFSSDFPMFVKAQRAFGPHSFKNLIFYSHYILPVQCNMRLWKLQKWLAETDKPREILDFGKKRPL
jgi:hypothetical protein